MPSPTARYRFEYHLLNWASAFSAGLCGEARGFFIGLRADGSVRRVYLAPPESEMGADRKTALADAYAAWLMFTPYRDEPGTYYLEWLGITSGVVRHWLGGLPEGPELEDVRDGAAIEQWPEAWRVIVRD